MAVPSLICDNTWNFHYHENIGRSYADLDNVIKYVRYRTEPTVCCKHLIQAAITANVANFKIWVRHFGLCSTVGKFEVIMTLVPVGIKYWNISYQLTLVNCWTIKELYQLFNSGEWVVLTSRSTHRLIERFGGESFPTITSTDADNKKQTRTTPKKLDVQTASLLDVLWSNKWLIDWLKETT